MTKTIAKTYFFILISGIFILSNQTCVAASFYKSRVDTMAKLQYPEKSNDISPLLIGETIPSIKVPAADGKLYDLNGYYWPSACSSGLKS